MRSGVLGTATPMSHSLRSAAGVLAGAVPGAVLGAASGAAAVVRRTKPLHPRGRVGEGLLDLTSPRPELSVPLLASAGTHPCVVRWSRATGLPAPLPDIEGLALRFSDPTADLLLAATGTGAVGRYLLQPRLPGRHGPLTSLLPVPSASGALLFRATPLDGLHPPSSWQLSAAISSGDWSPIGVLSVAWGPDRALRFDPVEHPLPGTGQYPLVRALREPAYFLARRGSAARPRTTTPPES